MNVSDGNSRKGSNPAPYLHLLQAMDVVEWEQRIEGSRPVTRDASCKRELGMYCDRSAAWYCCGGICLQGEA